MATIVRNQKSIALWALIVVLMGITIAACGKAPINKRSLVVMGGGGGDSTGQKPRPHKRTFCNAFTGCGRKRSDDSVPVKEFDQDERDGTAENSYDTVEDLARDILAEARLWEALEARNSMRYPALQSQTFSGRLKRSMGNEGIVLNEKKTTEKSKQTP